MKNRTVNISVIFRKFIPKESKKYKAFTNASLKNESDILITLDNKYFDRKKYGLEMVENFYHEITHAFIRMDKKRIMSESDEETLSKLIGRTVEGLMRGFSEAPRSVRLNRKYGNFIAEK